MSHAREGMFPMPDSEPRCNPSVPGPMVLRCARRLAPIRSHHKVRDYSTDAPGCFAMCEGFKTVDTSRGNR